MFCYLSLVSTIFFCFLLLFVISGYFFHVSEGPGGLTELQEAEKKNVHKCSSKTHRRVPNYDKTTSRSKGGVHDREAGNPMKLIFLRFGIGILIQGAMSRGGGTQVADFHKGKI